MRGRLEPWHRRGFNAYRLAGLALALACFGFALGAACLIMSAL